MRNGSLKEQLQAVAPQLSENVVKTKVPHKRPLRQQLEKPQKPKPKWLDYAQYGVELLRVYFPQAFKSPNEIKPLKKGIKEDLLKRLSTMEGIVTEDKACMVKSLAYYVNTALYHKSMVPGAMRVGLDGESTGEVTAEEAKYSHDKQQAKMQAKKAQSTHAAQSSQAPGNAAKVEDSQSS